MIPDYLTMIRFQDKRTFTFFSFTLLITLFFYWRNNTFSFTADDAFPVSIILAITLFNFISELKFYWGYSAALKRVDLRCFTGKTCSPQQNTLANPLVIAGISVALFWAIVRFCARLSSPLAAAACIFALSMVLIWLAYCVVRSLCIRQLSELDPGDAGGKRFSSYVGRYVPLIFIINLLSISPLKTNPAFSMADGFLSPELLGAMLILCAVVLMVNVLFSLPPKKYIFLGRLLLNDTDFNFSRQRLFPGLKRYSLSVKIGFLVVLQATWIFVLGMLLTAGNIALPFEVYYLLCGLPIMGYFYCHIYWYWHDEFIMACDMYFRFLALEKLRSEE